METALKPNLRASTASTPPAISAHDAWRIAANIAKLPELVRH
jgi:hypothetical protein